MKKVLVLSDSHKHSQTIVSAINKECPDCLIFCGDLINDLLAAKINLLSYAVKGNWDALESLPVEQTIKIEDVKIFITHGHKYKVKTQLIDLVKKSEKVNAQIVCFGHTHKPLCKIENNINLLNPGSIKNGSYAVLTINKNKFNVALKNL